MGRHSDIPQTPPTPSSPDLALYKASFQHPVPPYATPNLPHGGPFRLRALPVELQEQIFDQVLLDENPNAWEYLGANADTARSGELCLSLCKMRPPVLARVSKGLRADVLAHLFRTTTFRVDVSVDEEHSVSRRRKPRFKVEQRRKTVEWLRFLDGRKEVAIRTLQVRLQTPDSLEKRANVLFSYGAGRARWEVEMKVDEGWQPEEGVASGAQAAQLVSRPTYGDLIVLRRLLERVSALNHRALSPSKVHTDPLISNRSSLSAASSARRAWIGRARGMSWPELGIGCPATSAQKLDFGIKTSSG